MKAGAGFVHRGRKSPIISTPAPAALGGPALTIGPLRRICSFWIESNHQISKFLLKALSPRRGHQGPPGPHSNSNYLAIRILGPYIYKLGALELIGARHA